MPRVDDAKTVMRGYLARVGRSFMRLAGPEDPHNVLETWIPTHQVRIFWFIQAYRDLPRLRKTLARLRTLYPESQVLVTSDGDTDPEIKHACEEHAVEFTLRGRLFGVEEGGEPVQRMLDAFLETEADVLIKIDPDTNVRRRFSVLPSPADSCLYGTVQSASLGANHLTSIQGGCIIIPRRAATLLANSLLLTSDRLKPPALEWAVTDASRSRADSGLTSYDWTLGWACRELGLLAKDHPEVFSRHRPSLADAVTENRVAVSHPRFELRQLANHAFYFYGLRSAVKAAIRGGTDL
jgi:hypothetical protein